MTMFVVNPNHFTKLDEIDSDKAFYNVRVKILRLWEVSDFNRANNPFSIEMVLMDSEGGRIHATIKKTLIYKFKDNLVEGNVYGFDNLGVSANGGAYRSTHHRYKLNFQFSSMVQKLSNVDIKGSEFNFVHISEVVGGSYDTDYLVDVIGILTGVGTEREVTNQNGSTTKLNVIALEAQGHKLQRTLFGPYVDAKPFQDKIHIQNYMNCSKLYFNPNCPESALLRQILPESVENLSPITLTQIQMEPVVSPMDEFLFNTPRITLQGLKDSTTESVHVVCATVKKILNPNCFWYTACVCNKSVIPDSNMFFCEKCNKHVMKVFPRYCMKVRVMDHTYSASFVIFDRDAASLFNISCAEMLNEAQRNGTVGVVPPQISKLIDMNFLFKWDNEEASISKLNNEVGSLSTLLEKGKHLLGCSTNNILSQDSLSLTGSSGKGKGKETANFSSPVPITQDLMKKFTSTVINLEDDSLSAFDLIKTQESQTYVLSCKDLQSLSGSSLESEGKDVVVHGTPVIYLLQTNPTVVVNSASEGTKIEKTVVADDEVVSSGENDNIVEKELCELSGGKVDAKVLEATPVGLHQPLEASEDLAVVNLEDDSSQKDKVFNTPKACSSNGSKGVKGRKFVKRVSPDKVAEEDNAPIKLLKRVIKQEKM
ncbi:hypothetical protein P8452_47591 [Trifolium repens]|nr:hypothetical protein P8452_47591 [Trifolium repens]